MLQLALTEQLTKDSKVEIALLLEQTVVQAVAVEPVATG
jgi:hypothetical protein